MKPKHSPPKVLVLEITDHEINALFKHIKSVINQRTTTSLLHITLRGPYGADISKSLLDNCHQLLEGTTIRIHSAGRFCNPKEEVVFFRVDAPKLRDIWWKRDFPIKRFGFQPHISVYRGKDTQFAQKLEDFLNKEDIDLVTSEFKVVTRTIDQHELFAEHGKKEVDFSRLATRGNVSPTLLARLSKLIDRNTPNDA